MRFIDQFILQLHEPLLIVEAETGRVAFANPAALDLTGYEADELGELGIDDVFAGDRLPPDSGGQLLRIIGHCIRKDGTPLAITAAASTCKRNEILPHAHILESKFLVEGRTTDAFPSGTHTAGVSGQPEEPSDDTYNAESADVIVYTFQVDAESDPASEALRETNQILAAVYDTTHVMIAYLDVSHNYILVNRAYAKMYGQSPAYYSGKRLFDLFPDEENQRIFSRVTQTGHAHHAMAQPVYDHDGVVSGYLDWSLQPIKNSAGQVTALMLSQVDVTRRVKALEAVAESEERFRVLFEYASDAIVVFDADLGRFTHVNENACRLFGMSRAELYHAAPVDLSPEYQPDGRHSESAAMDFINQALDQEEPVFFEWHHRNIHGEIVPCEIRLMRMPPRNRRLVRGSLIDIRDRIEAQTQARKLSRALEQAADAVMITDISGVIEYVNPAFERMTGYGSADVLGLKPDILKSGFQSDAMYQELWHTILSGQVYAEIFVNRKRNGDLYYEEKTITPLKDERGVITHFVSTGKDITERLQTEERLHFMSYHDRLTELPNRLLFTDRLQRAITRAAGGDYNFAVLFVDIDRFKMINDTLGHEAGDQLLREFARRLQRLLSELDTIARMGSDEFAILLDSVEDVAQVTHLMRDMINEFNAPLRIAGRDLFVTASTGIALYPDDGTDMHTLIKNADIAMFRAKDSGRNTYQFYSADMSERALERLNLENNLRRALERQEFRLHFQPQIDIRTGRMIGAEALLRWEHQELGLIAPDVFIPILEESGLIIAVGDWILHAACSRARVWQAVTGRSFRLSVNLSARQCEEPDFADKVMDVLRGTELEPHCLELEITESVIMSNQPAVRDRFQELSAQGVRLAIDDFGTGYSSLSYIQKFPMNTLKIDRSFVRDITSDTDDAAIVDAIINMARSLHLDLVAEGVETEEQQEFLRERQCYILQGFRYSRPLPAEDFERLLHEDRAFQELLPGN
ncbi:MAG: EAL domain-containing protein [Leptospiraceae bacterium]|nr:EAL domain-containing protein [Leptospiraceae bacterium]